MLHTLHFTCTLIIATRGISFMVSSLKTYVPLGCLVSPCGFPLFGKNMIWASGPHEQKIYDKFLLKRHKHKLLSKSKLFRIISFFGLGSAGCPCNLIHLRNNFPFKTKEMNK